MCICNCGYFVNFCSQLTLPHCAAPQKTAQQICHAFLSDATYIGDKYSLGFTLYSNCYKNYSKSDVTIQDINDLSKAFHDLYS